MHNELLGDKKAQVQAPPPWARLVEKRALTALLGLDFLLAAY